MFKKLIDNLQKALKGREPVNPEVFNDPVAESTSWRPAKSGGANFRTHKMVRTSKTRIEFKPTIGGKLFSAIFALAGLGMLGGSIAMLVNDKTEELPVILILGFMGLVFAAVAFGMHRSMSTPTVLDASLGLFWKGRRNPALASNRALMKICIDLADIHAIQLIREYCRGSGKNSSSYYSYELNFVLHDGDRLNVIDHGNLARIREEAAILSDLLEIPVWDAT